MNQPKVAIIGAGKMGEAIIAGLLKSGKYSPKDIQAVEVAESRRKFINETYKVECFSDAKKAVKFGDIILIAVKPSIVGKVLEEIGPTITKGKVLVSIAAGVTLEFINSLTPEEVPIVRVMPNLACSVSEAMVTFCPTPNITNEELTMITRMLSLLGKVMRLDEKYLNLATGLVGSGPAYIYLIIDALADAGVRLGLPKDVSITLAAQTTLGAAKMVVETGEHPIKLKDKVATPAGTTVEGLLELERGRLRATIVSAVTKAAERAKGLMPA
ncbi:MAG: pyrroline-5-carboxylate reductase [Candidatus Bathyarchaeota archaeon]|nr:pyrroline-5-carboxylate reductase [Candidatus Bathyarchaeota archaeon]